MKATPTIDEVREKVADILAEVLMMPRAQISSGARILLELGAESIDLLDLRFRIEKTFGLTISSQDVDRMAGAVASPTEFRERFTVEALCGFIRERLETRGGG